MTNLGELRAFTVKEVADNFGVTIMTIRNYIKSGKLKARKVGVKYYITEDNLREFFEGVEPAKEDNNVQD